MDIGYPPKICFHELDELIILNPCLPHFLLRDRFVNLFQRVFDRYTCQCFRKIPWSSHYITSTLRKYEEMEKNTSLPKEQKLLAIQKELEEATACLLYTSIQ